MLKYEAVVERATLHTGEFGFIVTCMVWQDVIMLFHEQEWDIIPFVVIRLFGIEVIKHTIVTGTKRDVD